MNALIVNDKDIAEGGKVLLGTDTHAMAYKKLENGAGYELYDSNFGAVMCNNLAVIAKYLQDKYSPTCIVFNPLIFIETPLVYKLNVVDIAKYNKAFYAVKNYLQTEEPLSKEMQKDFFELMSLSTLYSLDGLEEIKNIKEVFPKIIDWKKMDERKYKKALALMIDINDPTNNIGELVQHWMKCCKVVPPEIVAHLTSAAIDGKFEIVRKISAFVDHKTIFIVLQEVMYQNNFVAAAEILKYLKGQTLSLKEQKNVANIELKLENINKNINKSNISRGSK
ncbi:MAG: hypothetical protein ACD_20C00030G0001 [uncultured bacterium]|nr:MAG: hypothetical protein ACD_20C00030G0001 [uncultured bacterium]